VAVSLETKGRRRQVDAVLNLVPFIDLLSVCITFLIATAVWVELSSLPVDQAVSQGPPSPAPAAPPLTLHVRADGVWVGRGPVSRVGEGYDWASVSRALAQDRSLHPEDRHAVLVTDDGVAYAHMIAALDAARQQGYDQPLLAGGSP
jgi:biopolymer transport protein TolR